MRDPDRIDRLTTKLFRLWRTAPDQRLFQLIQNALEDVYHVRKKDYFYTEDEDVEFAIDEALRKLGQP